MNIFQKIFRQRQAFVAYITAGHGGLDYTQQAAQALVEGGVDILEIGVPFSDPVADGPTIQAAMEQALSAGTTLHSVLSTIKQIKQHLQTPIVLFTYYNPLLASGLENTLHEAAKAGVDGMLVVDLPLEESQNYFEMCRFNKIEPIALLAPSTDAKRIKKISKHCHSFLYYVCRNGTTGVKDALPPDYVEKVSNIKSVTRTPVVSGFGIGNRSLASQALAHADGFVVGSAFVSAISKGATPEDLKKLAREIDPR